MQKYNNHSVDNKDCKLKKDMIINSALKCFGDNGYKKTSVNDIAVNADVSKALVFHYFKNKKNLYLYLVEFCFELIINDIELKFDKSETDFFARIMLIQDIKINIMKEYPFVFEFLKASYFEKNKEVKNEVEDFYKKSYSSGFNILFEGIDYSKFKDDVDPQMVLKMITWCAEGYMKDINFTNKRNIDLDLIKNGINKYLILLKQNLYREGN